jgi:hypothetical protein
MANFNCKLTKEGLFIPKDTVKAAKLSLKDELVVEAFNKKILIYELNKKPIFSESSPLWQSIGIGEDGEASGKEHDKYLY